MAYYDDLKKFGNLKVAIDDTGMDLSYSQLSDICVDMGNVLNKRKLVFSLCENSIGSLIGYVSFLYNRVVPLLLDRNIEHELRERLIDIYRPEYIYAPTEMTNEINHGKLRGKVIWSQWDYALFEIEYTDKGNDVPHDNYSIEKNADKGNDKDKDNENVNICSSKIYDELALLLTTSGSTGSPKLVRQSYKNIQSNAVAIAEYLKLTSDERPITVLPMNYTYGLSVINSHMLVGATIIMTKHTIMQREFWNCIKEKQATSISGVPYTYEMLKKLRFFRMDLPLLKTMTQAGGKLSPDLHKEFAEFAKEKNKDFIVMYGQTEATARMAYLPPEKALEKYGSMGIAIPGGRLVILDSDGNIIDRPDVVGELVYRGDNVTLGYAENREDLVLGDERNGVLETGDMARMDDDGYFYIVGRKKRFLKIFGNRVNLDECERIIKSGFQEIECACTGVDDKMTIYITTVDETLKKNVAQYVSHKLGIHNSAFEVKVISEIPKNEAGKILYKDLI